jgi:hypothetical protein
VVAIEDKASARLDRHFEACSSFISEGLREGAVLVHCQAGQSRSATVVIAHLMKEERWSAEAALRFVQQKRPSVHPNIGFMDQLRALQLKLGIQDCDGFENLKRDDAPAVVPVVLEADISVTRVEAPVVLDSAVRRIESPVVLEASDGIREENRTVEPSVGENSAIVSEEIDLSTLDVHVEISDIPDLFDAADTRLRCERLRARYQRLRNPSGILGVSALLRKRRYR